MAYMDDIEQRHLKRGKFGPLDVYPQEDRQKEDELSAEFVKSGFKYLMPELLREYEFQGVVKDQSLINNPNLDTDAIRLLLQIVNKKEEASINSQVEANKKQQGPPKASQTFRPSLILITGNQKTKEAAYAWFKQLANSEPLARLAKKIPVFNKRAENLPEIVITLFEYQVPISRAVWYLKIMVLAYSTNLNEVQKKKRQPNIDVSSEWSMPFIRFLREIFNRLQFYEYQQMHPNSNVSSAFSLENFMNVENISLILLPIINSSYFTENKLKCLWNFTTKLMRAMMDQNLLDKQYILDSYIDILEKSQSGFNQQLIQQQKNPSSQISQTNSSLFEYSSTKLILITKLLSRRLAYYCCKRLSAIFNEFSNCFFEKTLKKLQTKSTDSNKSTSSLLKSNSATSLLSPSSQQQQKSPDLNATKLKPFVTNLATMTTNTSSNQTKNPTSNSTSNPTTDTTNYILQRDVPIKSVKLLFDKFVDCHTHRDQIILLTSIVQSIQLGNMQSLIWNKVGDEKMNGTYVESPYNGSPLDLLPCPLSELLYTYDYYGINGRTKHYVKSELEKAELCIKRRSIAVEKKWATDKLRQASIAIFQTKILAILDILDKHCYGLTDINETIEILYAKIFPKIKLGTGNNSNAGSKKARDANVTNKEDSAIKEVSGEASEKKTNTKENVTESETNFIDIEADADEECEDDEETEIKRPLTDREIIHLLCDWATTTKRCGMQRIFYVVFLIKKRQIDLITQFKEANEAIAHKIKSKLINHTKRVQSILSKKKLSDLKSTSKTNLNSNESPDVVSRKRKMKANDSDDESQIKIAKLGNDMTTSVSKQISAQLNSSKKIKLEKMDEPTIENSQKIFYNGNDITQMEVVNNQKSKLKTKPKMSKFALKTLKRNQRSRFKNKLQAYKRLERQQQKLDKKKELQRNLENKSYEFLFQSVLFDYLEYKAPYLNNYSYDTRLRFANLISLYYMLINCRLFSHDQLVCTLISRGETFQNNLNDIKRPSRLLINRDEKKETTSVNQTNNLQQSQSTSQLRPSFSSQMSMQSNSNNNNKRNSIDYASPMSVYNQPPASMPPYNFPPHTPLQHQKSTSSITTANGVNDPYAAPLSVPTPSRSSSITVNKSSNSQFQQQSSVNQNASLSQVRKGVPIAHSFKTKSNNVRFQTKPLSKLALYVLHLPIPQTKLFQHERNQRFVVLFGFGSKKQEMIDKNYILTKNLKNLFSREMSIDLSESVTQQSTNNLNTSNTKRQNNNTNPNLKKQFNTITTANFALTPSESDRLNQLNAHYSRMSYYDQYCIMKKLITHLIETYKTLESKNFLPKLQFIQFMFDIMESNLNIFNLLQFAIRLLRIGPLIERYLKQQFAPNPVPPTNRICYFEYLSYFYLNIIGVLRLHLTSLILWKDLAIQAFNCLFKVVQHIERPSKCSSHEKSAFMLLNEMYGACSFLKTACPLFEPLAGKIKSEKCFIQVPSLVPNLNAVNNQMRSDEMLTSMIFTTDHTIDDIESYISSKNLYYNFVAHVFVSIPNLNKDEMLRVANLCAELTSRCNILIAFWHNASKALHQRNTEPTREKAMFSELLNKINIQIPRCKENFKLFLSILAARHCLILNDLIVMVVKTCVIACPGITPDQCQNYALLEPSASLACHIIQYLFTSAPKPLIYRKSTYDQRMITASFRCLCFNKFLLVLKCLFLLSEPKKEPTPTPTASAKTSGKNSGSRTSERNHQSSVSNKETGSINSSEEALTGNEQIELDQFAASVLYEICAHDWIKERCFNEGDNLLKQNQLLEPALGRRAQNLLQIIFYPHMSHHSRKQNEQSSTKDFIKSMLQNLDLWTLRESLLEFKLMYELEKQKEKYHEYFVECLAKTTVEFLIDPDRSTTSSTSESGTSSSSNAKSGTTNIQNKNLNSKNKNIIMNNSKNTKPNNNSSKMVPNNNKNKPAINSKSVSRSISVTSIHSSNRKPIGAITTNINNSSTKPNNAGTDSTILINTDLDIHIADQDEFDYGHDELESYSSYYRYNQPIGIWLIGPLITKLQANCQLKVLEHASKTLQDIGKAFWTAKTKPEKETHAIKNITTWNQKPFFSLIMSFLKCKELNNNEKEVSKERALLTSLYNGLGEFVSHYGKEEKNLSEDPRIKQITIETLHVRLSLVGSMFDFILKNQNDFINWAWLFVQLVFSGVIDPDNDQLLFTMVIDMLAVLIHHIISLEPIDTNKCYQAIIKKISKETKDFSDVPNNKAINYIRRLMPLNRNACLEVLTVDSITVTGPKAYASVLDKRRGYKFAKKERINAWELIEGVKNASSLCFSWYGGSKLEKKMLRYEYQQKLLARHNHMNIHKELTYFKEKPDLPPTDLIDAVEPYVPVEVPLPPPPLPPASSILNIGSNNANSVTGSANVVIKKEKSLDSSNTADIVVLGSNMPPPPQMQHHHNMINHHHPMMMNQHHNGSHMMVGQPNQQPLQSNMHLNNTQPPPPNHEQVLSRIQQNLHQQHPPPPHHQQQQHQLGMSLGPNGGPLQPSQLQHGQSFGHMGGSNVIPLGGAPIAPNNSTDRKGTQRSLSTPDKQKSGSAKKRTTTTPRRGANVRNATANAAATAASATQPPLSSQQPTMIPINPQQQQAAYQMNPKLIAPQQQQQQRSTNSPMLIGQQPAYPNNAIPPASVVNQAGFMNRPQMSAQLNPGQPQQQMSQLNVPRLGANQQQTQPPLTQPQQHQFIPNQQQQQIRPPPPSAQQQQQMNRSMSYPTAPVTGPAPPPLNPANTAIQNQLNQQQRNKIPVNPQQQQMYPALQQQQQQPPGRLIQAQPSGQFNTGPATVKGGANDPNLIQQQQQHNLMPKQPLTQPTQQYPTPQANQANYMTNPQQQQPPPRMPLQQPQQQPPPRMQYQMNAAPPASAPNSLPNQQQNTNMGWQQQQRQAMQQQQQRPIQPQQQQFQQQQQFMPKQPISNQVPNPGMMQQHNNLVQQPTQPNQPGVQQQQQRVNIGQQPPQQYQNY